mmetsp:Transcript_39466/g.63249  ORF Transcript_39466/g.63249 Transcript_39466/m.63249 type:complete len:200 (+) Transcript_39466:479-1078(+)
MSTANCSGSFIESVTKFRKRATGAPSSTAASDSLKGPYLGTERPSTVSEKAKLSSRFTPPIDFCRRTKSSEIAFHPLIGSNMSRNVIWMTVCRRFSSSASEESPRTKLSNPSSWAASTAACISLSSMLLMGDPFGWTSSIALYLPGQSSMTREDRLFARTNARTILSTVLIEPGLKCMVPISTTRAPDSFSLTVRIWLE